MAAAVRRPYADACDRLIVAAGGGGDAVAAAMPDAALYGAETPAVVLTYAWDRLLADPMPGPGVIQKHSPLGQVVSLAAMVAGMEKLGMTSFPPGMSDSVPGALQDLT
ncbi:DUF1152 domain-containing protein [Streptomyces kronopolitis]